jgi:hypothetical protein
MKGSYKLAVETLKGCINKTLARLKLKGVDISSIEAEVAAVDVDGDLNTATEQLKNIIKKLEGLWVH